jgi:hypothetical protein
MTDDEPTKERRKTLLTPGQPMEPPPRESRRAKQRRLKRPPGRPRNPHHENAFVPNAEQKQLVRLLSGFGIPGYRIIKVIKNPLTGRGIGLPTLERCFVNELAEGSVEMDAAACAMLAMRVRQGNLTAIIWYMKNRMGWHDHVVQERTGTGNEIDVNIKIDPDQLADELTRRNLPLSVFGVDKPAPLPLATPRSPEPDPLPEVTDADDAEAADEAAERFLENRLRAHISRHGGN